MIHLLIDLMINQASVASTTFIYIFFGKPLLVGYYKPRHVYFKFLYKKNLSIISIMSQSATRRLLYITLRRFLSREHFADQSPDHANE